MRSRIGTRLTGWAGVLGGNLVTALILLAVFLVTESRHTQFATSQATNFSLFLLLVCSMQLMLGFSDQSSLMHAAVYGMGAYVAVYMEAKTGTPLIVALLAAVASGAVLGAVLAYPLSRLREHFFAMATLAAQVILSQTFENLNSLTGGVNGEATVHPSLNSLPLLALILAIGFLIIAATRSFKSSRLGRRVLALREDETMARSEGVNVTRLRIVMVMISFAIASGSGFFLAETSGFISPDGFTLTSSLAVIVAVIVGGRSLTWGALVGAGAYSALTGETINTPGLSVLILGIVLVVVLAYLPKGITGFRLATWFNRFTPSGYDGSTKGIDPLAPVGVEQLAVGPSERRKFPFRRSPDRDHALDEPDLQPGGSHVG